LLLLVGWGLVGLSSYLLIGFWHERPSAVRAAKKAFVMNAFGDATMALALFILIAHTSSLSFSTAFSVHLSSTATNLVALGLLGYMYVGVGVGAYSNGIFHLLTHSFFKALLFMTAGLAIHALAGEQDIRNMRGLGRVMPFTKWCFLAGALALVGIPPFSGFFSKDSIIASAAALGTWYGWIFWVCCVAGAFLTGLYTFRLWYLVFPGDPSPFVLEHHHKEGRWGEGPWTMLLPVGGPTVLA